MGKDTGFIEYERAAVAARDPLVRLGDFNEIYLRGEEPNLRTQAARCMDCGVPFCQCDAGCPCDNLIPEWNDLVYRGKWKAAYERLSRTINFPEFTGRTCPAPCEQACVLGITDPPVTIKDIEREIIDRAFEYGWVKPRAPGERTGCSVAIIGSGPAGLAAADQLNRAGHWVTVFERDDRIGGLLMYGVPNMKLDKRIVQRRVDLLAAEGIRFRPNCNVGVDMRVDRLVEHHDAIILACGALRGRDLVIPGRHLKGICMAVAYLRGVTKSLLDSQFQDRRFIDVRNHDVVVIGGGDTGTDCIATALRHGCRSLVSITRREREPDERDEYHPWPGAAGVYFLDYAHAEGKARFGDDPRDYGVLPLEFVADRAGRVQAVKIERLQWTRAASGEWICRRTGRIEQFPAQDVFLAVGFVGHDSPAVVKQLGVAQEGGLVRSDEKYQTNVAGVFVAGDMRRGMSLIVRAIAEGRGAARACERYLAGSSRRPPRRAARSRSMPAMV